VQLESSEPLCNELVVVHANVLKEKKFVCSEVEPVIVIPNGFDKKLPAYVPVQLARPHPEAGFGVRETNCPDI
jgi:hypothetical protein